MAYFSIFYAYKSAPTRHIYSKTCTYPFPILIKIIKNIERTQD